MEDVDAWNQYTQSVKKLKNKSVIQKRTVYKTSSPINIDQPNQVLLAKFKIPPPPPPLQKKRNLVAPPEDSIDLHGLTQAQAFTQLSQFLEKSYHSNKKHVLVITGKGPLDQPGIIKLAVPRWLQYTELKQHVATYSTAEYRLGGEGAISVFIRKKEKL